MSELIEAPLDAAPASAKSVASTPVTVSPNLTVYETEEAFVGVTFTRLIDVTVGGVVSFVRATVSEPVFPPAVTQTRIVFDPSDRELAATVVVTVPGAV